MRDKLIARRLAEVLVLTEPVSFAEGKTRRIFCGLVTDKQIIRAIFVPTSAKELGLFLFPHPQRERNLIFHNIGHLTS